MANLHANVLQVSHDARIAECFEMLTTRSARLMNLTDYGIAVGNPADVVVLDCQSSLAAVAELASPILGFKRGRETFCRPGATINWPNGQS